MKDKGFTVTGSDQSVYPPDVHIPGRKKKSRSSTATRKKFARKPTSWSSATPFRAGTPRRIRCWTISCVYCSLPELLREFFIRGKRSLVVAGTHGKTTTTSLLTLGVRAQRIEIPVI